MSCQRQNQNSLKSPEMGKLLRKHHILIYFYYYFWPLNNDRLDLHTNPDNISVMQQRFSSVSLGYLWSLLYAILVRFLLLCDVQSRARVSGFEYGLWLAQKPAIVDLLLRMKVNSKRTSSNLLCLLGSRTRISALLRILRYTSKLRHFSRVSRVSSTGKSVLPT